MADKDAMTKRLLELREEHRKLDSMVDDLLGGSSYDQIETQRLKKRKLHLKDEIAHLESALLPDIIA